MERDSITRQERQLILPDLLSSDDSDKDRSGPEEGN